MVLCNVLDYRCMLGTQHLYDWRLIARSAHQPKVNETYRSGSLESGLWHSETQVSYAINDIRGSTYRPTRFSVHHGEAESMKGRKMKLELAAPDAHTN